MCEYLKTKKTDSKCGKNVAGYCVRCIFPLECISMQTDAIIEASAMQDLGKTAANKPVFSYFLFHF